MIDKSLIAIVISVAGFAFTLYQFKRNTRIERIRAYDKVYEDACDLLMYHYRQAEEVEYEDEDKELEKAVRTYSKLH